MKFEFFLFKAVVLALRFGTGAGAGKARLRRQVEEQRQVGRALRDREIVQRVDRFGVEAAPPP